ncbi:MAG TPA: hypothetical protein VFY70_12620 [Thermomicrobiales bacterium]|nr:hypothetical protein [Thermomicrobiales bacterium]
MDELRTQLERFIGEWTMRVTFPGAPPFEGGRVVFEWMSGERFLIQRWEVPVPEAPDGLAIIGFDAGRGTLLQHYFDSRGIARVYTMSLEDGIWTLRRDTPDFSPLEFAQRFTGRFSGDDGEIVGRWEIAHDGVTWEHDFDLTYLRVR